MKTRMKRLISLLCAVTVFASTALSTDFLSAKVEASGGQGKESLPTNMTEISFRDFDIADIENYQGWAGKEYTGETLDNTLFSGTVIFPEVADAYITYAGASPQEGLGFMVAQDANTQEWYLKLRHSNTALLTEQKITDTTAGVELVGVPLELRISMEYVDNDNLGEENDLKLGIWFGDNLYKGDYIYINDYVGAKKTGNYLTYNSKKPNGGAITLRSTNIKLPNGMTKITLKDFNIADGEYSTSFSGNYAGQTMDNTLFSAKIKYSETGVSHFVYGGTKSFGGFALQNAVDQDEKSYLRMWDTDRENMKFQDKKFYADKAGVGTFIDKEFTLNYTMEYVNNDGGTTKNDLKLGVWFNGKLYENKYIYIDNYVDNDHSIGGYVTIWPQNGATLEVKSCNYQLPDDMTDISFRDFDIADIENYQGWAGKEYTGETLDNTLFSGTVIFPEVAGAYITYAGASPQEGLGFTVAQDANTQEWYLKLRHSNTALLTEQKITDKTAAVELVGVPLELHISMEYVDNDNQGEENDLKLGIWFGDTLYKDEYIYINDYVGANKTGAYLTYNSKKNDGGAITLKSADITLPENMTEITFRDFGYVDGDISQYPAKQYDGDTLDGTLFGGKITFPEVANAFMQYGGKEAKAGFNLGTAYDEQKGEWYLRLFNAMKAESEANFSEVKLYSDKAQVDALVGEEIELNLTVEYVDYDKDGAKDDVKLGVWFNGKLYNNNYIYLKDYADATYSMGTWMSFSVPSTTKVEIESVGEINWKPLPTGLTEITFRDFGYVDGDISRYPAKQYEGDTLDGTLFGGKITFPEVANAFLQYGGKEAEAGFNLGTAYDDEREEWYLRLFNAKKAENETNFAEVKLYSDVAQVNALVGEEIELNLTVEYVDYDGDSVKDDVKLGVWFNSKLYNNNYIYLKDYADATYTMGTWMSFSVPGTTKVVIESVGEINWKPLPTGLTEITFRDFGYVDGDITQYPAKQYEGNTLDGTLFGGKITFPEVANAFLQYGGKEAEAGFNLGTAYDDEKEEWYLRLFNAKKAETETNFSEVKLYSDVAQVDALVGEEIELNLTVEYVDYDGDSAKNDVKLGVWFNGKLYNNNYIYLKDYADATYTMGTWMSFSVAKTTKINIKSVGTINWKDVPTGMTEITFRDFGFTDGDYTRYPEGQYEGKTLDNTLFIGKITFPESPSAHLIYGGKVADGGFDIVPAQDTNTGEWYLRLFDTNHDKSGKKFSEYKFYSNVAGVPLVGEEVALMLSLQYVDKDGDGKKNDVQLGVWFAGKLYNNQYIYLKDFVNTGHSMGNWMKLSIAKTTKINIKSVGKINWKPLPTGLTEIGFSDFGIASGVYEGGSKVGEYKGENLRNTLFSGIVKWYPEVGETHFIYGGTTSEGGFDIVNVTDEKTGEHYLRLFYTTPTKDGKKTYTNYHFYSNVAGVTLVGEELDLKISIEYVDHDGKKTNNDVRLGIWFAGKLYNNRYIYIDNFGATGHIWKNNIQIWNREGASFGVGRQSDWLDWSAFGLTANWKKTLLDTNFNLKYALAGGNPYTGDNTNIPYSMLIASVAVIALCGCQIVRRRRNGYDL